MTNTELSRIIARAILDGIERDGCCNLANIEDAVFREIAVAEARLREQGAAHPTPGQVSDRLHSACLAMLSEIRAHGFLGRHHCFDITVDELQAALKEAMS